MNLIAKTAVTAKAYRDHREATAAADLYNARAGLMLVADVTYCGEGRFVGIYGPTRKLGFVSACAPELQEGDC